MFRGLWLTKLPLLLRKIPDYGPDVYVCMRIARMLGMRYAPNDTLFGRPRVQQQQMEEKSRHTQMTLSVMFDVFFAFASLPNACECMCKCVNC